MASLTATKRLTKEYRNLTNNPETYILAHPSESNILEWHYLITGPPDTPYVSGQYWGTLMFPADYPFAPPAIRMHTPSGRFQPSTRLCLSISDFHPKSFNPAWEVRTILIGLLSFMTSEEMTTGSVRATPLERKLFAQRSRWWNSTGGGSANKNPGNTKGIGRIMAGDGGAKFQSEWPAVHLENLKWLQERDFDMVTGMPKRAQSAVGSSCAPETAALRRRMGGSMGLNAVVEGAHGVGEAGQTWLGRYKWWIVGGAFFFYVFLARVLSDGS